MKLPFPLTIRFKSMLQSGVATRDLDVRWVSSLSWYFLNLFGLQSVFIFLLGDDNGTFVLVSPYHSSIEPLLLCIISHVLHTSHVLTHKI